MPPRADLAAKKGTVQKECVFSKHFSIVFSFLHSGTLFAIYSKSRT